MENKCKAAVPKRKETSTVEYDNANKLKLNFQKDWLNAKRKSNDIYFHPKDLFLMKFTNNNERSELYGKRDINEERKSSIFTQNQRCHEPNERSCLKIADNEGDKEKKYCNFQKNEELFKDTDILDPSDECIRINPIPTFQYTFEFSSKKGKKRDPNDNKDLRNGEFGSKIATERPKIFNKVYFQPSFVKDSKVSTEFTPHSNSQFLFNKRNLNKCGTSNLKKENGMIRRKENKFRSIQNKQLLKIKIPGMESPSKCSGFFEQFSDQFRAYNLKEENKESSHLKYQYSKRLPHEEIKEEVEKSSFSNEEQEIKSAILLKRSFLTHRNTLLINDLNPFLAIENNSGSNRKSVCTPEFKNKTKSNIFSFKKIKYCQRKDSVDYNEPSRYLYEFFTHRRYQKFREEYLKYSNDSYSLKSPESCTEVKKSINKQKINLFVEIK